MDYDITKALIEAKINITANDNALAETKALAKAKITASISALVDAYEKAESVLKYLTITLEKALIEIRTNPTTEYLCSNVSHTLSAARSLTEILGRPRAKAGARAKILASPEAVDNINQFNRTLTDTNDHSKHLNRTLAEAITQAKILEVANYTTLSKALTDSDTFSRYLDLLLNKALVEVKILPKLLAEVIKIK